MLTEGNSPFSRVMGSTNTVWNVSKYGIFSGPYFPAFGPEKTPYLDTFHAVQNSKRNPPISVSSLLLLTFWCYKYKEVSEILSTSTYFEFQCLKSKQKKNNNNINDDTNTKIKRFNYMKSCWRYHPLFKRNWFRGVFRTQEPSRTFKRELFAKKS